MTTLGFWHFAAKDPSLVGLVTPEGEEVSRGELLAASNRMSHGLREMGLQKGDCVAMVIAETAEIAEAAADCVLVEYDPIAAVAGIEQATAEDAIGL